MIGFLLYIMFLTSVDNYRFYPKEKYKYDMSKIYTYKILISHYLYLCWHKSACMYYCWKTWDNITYIAKNRIKNNFPKNNIGTLCDYWEWKTQQTEKLHKIREMFSPMGDRMSPKTQIQIRGWKRLDVLFFSDDPYDKWCDTHLFL